MEKKEKIRQIPEASLAQTLADHKKMGSTPSQILKDNPGKTLAETMSDEQLKVFILKQVNDVREQYGPAIIGGELERKILKIALNYLVPNIEYLRKIKRLPAELKDFDPKKEFSLPS